MDRFALFVDAGYLYVGGAKAVSGQDGVKRAQIRMDVPVAVASLIEKAKEISRLELLRVYWYDARLGLHLSTDHTNLASSNHVKLRLGVLNGVGQQKGVDGRIITDLTELARNRAFADAVLLGGDEDLRIGVELAQEYGTRVHLLTIEGSPASETLRQEADTVHTLAKADISAFLTVNEPHTAKVVSIAASETATTNVEAPAAQAATPLPANDGFLAVAQREIDQYLDQLSAEEQVGLTNALRTAHSVPSEHDGRLLARTRNAIGRPLESEEKTELRKLVKRTIRSSNPARTS